MIGCRPEQAREHPLLDHEVDAVECGEVAEALDEALRDDTLHGADGTRTLANPPSDRAPIAADRAPDRALAPGVSVTVSPSPYDPEHVGRARHRALRARRRAGAARRGGGGQAG